MKKNILHIIESSETGGAETVFIKLISSIDKDNFPPKIVLLNHGWLFDQLVARGYEPTVIKSTKAFDFRLLMSLIIYIVKHNIKMIHAHLFGIGVYATVVAKICRIPIVVTLHGAMDANILDTYLKLKIAVLNRFASKIVYVSNYLCNCYNRLGLKNNSTVIYNGIDPAVSVSKSVDCREEIGLNSEDIVVGSVGDIRPPKGYEYLVEAAYLLAKTNNKVKFVVAGSETPLLDDLKKLCDALELADMVRFIGYRDDIANIYNMMDIFLLPSISEGFSLSTIEALSHGLPVIATRCGGPEEIIENNFNGILINKGSSEEIAGAVAKLLSDGMLRSCLKANAKKTAESKFAVKTMVGSYEELYAKLLRCTTACNSE